MAGRFRLIRQLGEGGMGSVWVAWHEALGAEVAIKFIEFAAGNREDLLARFSREAMAVAKVKSSHVVGVVDYGVDEQLGRPYLVMELLDGESLGARVERGPLPVRDAVEIVRQICRGLGKAHQAGIVHRDIKPDNIFLCPEEDTFVAKLLDFGVAKTSGPLGGSHGQTSTGALLGTPLYMSPEQALGTKVVDARSDLYSLTVVAYHALCGQPPFTSPGLGELIMFITSQQPPAPRSLRPDLPPALEAWLLKGLDKDPARRFQSAREMGDELLAAFDGGQARSSLMFDEMTQNRPRPSTSGTVVMSTGSGSARQASSPSLSGETAGDSTRQQAEAATLSGTSKTEPGAGSGGAKRRVLIAAAILVPAAALAVAAALRAKGDEGTAAAHGLVAPAPSSASPAAEPPAAPPSASPAAGSPGVEPVAAPASASATGKALPAGKAGAPPPLVVPKTGGPGPAASGPGPAAGGLAAGKKLPGGAKTPPPPPPPTSTW